MLKLAPNIDLAKLLQSGTPEPRENLSGSDLTAVLQAYMSGLEDAWAMGIARAGITFLFAFAPKW